MPQTQAPSWLSTILRSPAGEMERRRRGRDAYSCRWRGDLEFCWSGLAAFCNIDLHRSPTWIFGAKLNLLCAGTSCL